jgi:hypothetical protein
MANVGRPCVRKASQAGNVVCRKFLRFTSTQTGLSAEGCLTPGRIEQQIQTVHDTHDEDVRILHRKVEQPSPLSTATTSPLALLTAFRSSASLLSLPKAAI